MRAANTIKASTGIHSNEHTTQNTITNTALHGRWLVFAWITGGTFAIFALIVYVTGLPAYYVQLQMICTNGVCVPGQLSPGGAQTLQHIGISFSLYTLFAIVLNIVTALVWFSIAVVLIWRKYNDWMALLVALTLVLVTAAVPPDQSAPLWQWPIRCVDFLAVVLLFLVFSLFPNGRFVPGWMCWLPVVYSALNVLDLFPNLLFDLPYWLNLLYLFLLFGCIGILGITQIYRYRRMSNAVERQQIKWVVFSCTTVISGELVLWLLTLIFPSFWRIDSLYDLYFNLVSIILILLIPVSLGTAILRYRLWDIDIIINRTLVYGTLTIGVVGSYALVVGGLGALFEVRGTFVLSLLATGLIAVLFQPVHLHLQRAVNRLMYGERDEPYRVISRLGSRLEATLAPEAVLPAIVETVAQALKLPYAAITLKQDGEYVIAASYGRPSAELMRLPLMYQSEQMGDLLLAPRAPGETFSSGDQTLLDDLARQAGIAVHSVRLTTDLQRLTRELQHSRTQLVTAREEERRRLRRDLHDGLGSVLASLNWRSGAIRSLLSRDPAAAETLVVEQQQTIRAAITDIRRLVYDLRPPALDELGLVGAIRERAAQQATPAVRDDAQGLRIDVVAPDHLPPLPAAVEVAAYRIVQEALANVTHHAHAHRCSIRLECSKEFLRVEVTDDGTGLLAGYHLGVGLLSMRERAEELGGTCEITQAPSGGTHVQACLPLSRE